MKLITLCKSFSNLTPTELYQVLRLRSEVFVVEQKCVFLDMDNKDQYCDHVMIWKNEQLVATSRLVPPGLSYEQMSIGRIVTHPSVRKEGVGKSLLNSSIELIYARHGKSPIKIGAQYYLRDFYNSFGFVQCSEIYDEDGIDHILMLKDTV